MDMPFSHLLHPLISYQRKQAREPVAARRIVSDFFANTTK